MWPSDLVTLLLNFCVGHSKPKSLGLWICLCWSQTSIGRKCLGTKCLQNHGFDQNQKWPSIWFKAYFTNVLNCIETVQHQKVFVKVLLKVRNPKYFEPNYKSALLLFLRPTLRWISEQSLSAFHSSNARLYKKVSNSTNFWALDLQQHLRPTAHFENWIRMCRNVPSARRFLFHSIFLISIQCFEIIEVCQVRSFVALVLILAIDKPETDFC